MQTQGHRVFDGHGLIDGQSFYDPANFMPFNRKTSPNHEKKEENKGQWHQPEGKIRKQNAQQY
jgi:hypothetical protein